MENVVSLADQTGDNRRWCARQMLATMAEEYGDAPQMICIAWIKDDDGFSAPRMVVNMANSEIVALLEWTKLQVMLEMMGDD